MPASLSRASLLLPIFALYLPAQTPLPENRPLQSELLVVGPPKIYDDLYLQSLLGSLQSQLAAIHGVDQTTLLGHIGAVQGADSRQTSASISASGPSSASPASSSPSVPVAPASALAVPSLGSLGQGSLDTYNESLQLSSEIANTSLLLNGALSDTLQPNGDPKTTVTIGFPITVSSPTPSQKSLSGAVAEVRVTICSDAHAGPPSILTLLPRERSYNVASLVDRSFLGSASAVLGGVVNVGGGFFSHHQTYYLVQQQETVAFLDTAAAPACSGPASSFTWQIRPVLGKPFIRPGNSVNFVRISVPEVIGDAPTKSIGAACVSIVWRKPAPAGLLRKPSSLYLLPASPAETRCYDIDYYRTLTDKTTLTVTDTGEGAVTVKVAGTFLPGTTVRLGSSYLAPENITATHDALTFTAPASAIVAAGQVFLVGRDGREVEAVNHPDPRGNLTLTGVVIDPYSADRSLVTIKFSLNDNIPGDHGPALVNPAVDPWVVVIGGKVFGLSDAPFLSQSTSQIELIVPNELVERAPAIELRRLLWPAAGYLERYAIPPAALKSVPVIERVTLLSTGNGLALALSGSALDHLKLVFPSESICPGCRVTSFGPTFAQVTLPKPPPTLAPKSPPIAGALPLDPTSGLSHLVLCRTGANGECDPNFAPVLAAIPEEKDSSASKSPPKPSLDKHDPIHVAAAPQTLGLTGSLLDQVTSVEYSKTPLTFHLVAGKVPALSVVLPASLVSTPGVYPLVVTFADKSSSVFPLEVR